MDARVAVWVRTCIDAIRVSCSFADIEKDATVIGALDKMESGILIGITR
jgi:hypothetical protein